ncbi:MAG: DUF6600 domain-containing protein [Verrucomicrobiota bacterium]
MKKLFLIVLTGAALFSCQKQQTDQERQAEVERQVQDRLAKEHQQEQAEQLSQREADVATREQTLRTPETFPATPAATAVPEERAEPVIASGRREAEPRKSYNMFYEKLEPYGDWVETSDYGYVYHPREATGAQWRPYTNGKWAYTDAGWTWISEEPFGWATYHYGRWTRLHNVGWVWVPGEEWAPAWVSWRKGSEFVGWAPLPPEARFERTTGIQNWSDSYYDVGPDQYVFVPTRQLGETRIERAIVPSQQNITIVSQTTNVTNISYNNTVIVNRGPSYEEITTQTAQPIPRLRLEREAGLGANPRAIVRGDVVAFPAPVINMRSQDRPRAVKQNVGAAAADRGWNAVTDRQAADKARAKIKAESTPPPNAPAKKFQREDLKSSASATPAASSAVKPATPVWSGSTPAPAATVPPAAAITARPLTSLPIGPATYATPSPVSTPRIAPSTPLPPARASTPPPPRPSTTPVRPRPSVAPTTTPAATVASTTPPVPAISATPFMSEQERRHAERQAAKGTDQKLRSADEQRRRQEMERARARNLQGAPSPAPSAPGSSRPAATTPPAAHLQPFSNPRPVPPGNNPAAVRKGGVPNRGDQRVPQPTPSIGAPAVAPSPSPDGSAPPLKRGAKVNPRAGGAPLRPTPSPTPTATPSP